MFHAKEFHAWTEVKNAADAAAKFVTRASRGRDYAKGVAEP